MTWIGCQERFKTRGGRPRMRPPTGSSSPAATAASATATIAGSASAPPYDAASHTVTLTPRTRLAARTVMQLVASGSTTGAAVRDVWGRPINGDRDGHPAGNAVTPLGPTRARQR